VPSGTVTSAINCAQSQYGAATARADTALDGTSESSSARKSSSEANFNLENMGSSLKSPSNNDSTGVVVPHDDYTMFLV
jgi:hypothetical protein